MSSLESLCEGLATLKQRADEAQQYVLQHATELAPEKVKDALEEVDRINKLCDNLYDGTLYNFD